MLHIRVELEGERRPQYVWDIPDERTVVEQYIRPWRSGGTLVLNERSAAADRVRRLQVFSSAGSRADLEDDWLDRANVAASDGVFAASNDGEMWLRLADERTEHFLSAGTGP